MDSLVQKIPLNQMSHGGRKFVGSRVEARLQSVTTLDYRVKGIYASLTSLLRYAYQFTQPVVPGDLSLPPEGSLTLS